MRFQVVPMKHGFGHHDHKPGFFTRWFCSTNHKDIGTLYIIFSIFAGIWAERFSMLMRMELQDPGYAICG
jgi:cytochrome c oxidase subunit 1